MGPHRSSGGSPPLVVEATDRTIASAATALRRGELVAFPTETVYGLGADATDEVAVGRVFEVKGRPTTDPLIVHVGSTVDAGRWGDLDVGRGDGLRLAREFWPGPLTLVVPRREGLARAVGAGLASVGLRVPAHPVALELIRAAGVPLAAPSANRFGRVSPTTAGHVVSELDGRITMVLDGGATPLGVESTVLELSDGPPRVLRPGGVAVEDLRDVVADVQVVDRRVDDAGRATTSPGTLLGHYAPATPLTLVDADRRVARSLVDALGANGVEAALVELPEDPVRAAAELYSALRSVDAAGADLALVVAVDGRGLGRAVNDRLFRAAHGHVVAESTDEAVARLRERARKGPSS